MILLSPDGSVLSRPPRLSREALRFQIARRHAALAELETEMVAACEAAAGGAPSKVRATSGRECRDRMTWHRYLAAAMRLEATYGPPMSRLRLEIGQLERLMALPIAA
jgi:hypothetical protein